MELSYTCAGEEDIEAVYSFCRELILQYEDLSSIDRNAVLGWVRRKLEHQIGEYTCVWADAEKAGYYHFAPSQGEMELDDLYLFPPYRGQGIGTAVLRRCLSSTQLPVFLYVFCRNTRAVALYRRMGFSVAQTVHNTRYLMRWEGENAPKPEN